MPDREAAVRLPDVLDRGDLTHGVPNRDRVITRWIAAEMGRLG